MIERLLVVGVGLIGGSFALALKSAGVVRQVVGVGRTQGSIARALEMGVVDAIGTDASVVRGADLVLLAMPVGQTREVMHALAPHLDGSTVVTDAGSTKRDVVEHAHAELAGSLDRFVPAHPIAGAEHSGVGAASAKLYIGRKVVLTPLAQNSERAVALVRQAWEACGALVQSMQPEQHDAVFAQVSHLPHVLAYALVDEVANHPDAARLFEFAASGFRDFTRIASSHPEMWRDICMSNRDALLEALGRYQEGLVRMRALLEAGDARGMEDIFERARAARNRWLEALK